MNQKEIYRKVFFCCRAMAYDKRLTKEELAILADVGVEHIEPAIKFIINGWFDETDGGGVHSPFSIYFSGDYASVIKTKSFADTVRDNYIHNNPFYGTGKSKKSGSKADQEEI